MRRDLACGAILLLTAVSFWVQRDYSSQLTASFPDFVLVVLALAGVTILVRGARSGERARAPRQVDMRFMAAAVVLMLAWGVGMGLIGFTISGVLAFVVMAQLIRRARPRPLQLARDFGVGLVVVGGSFFVFTRVLYVPLPVSVLIGM